MSIELRNVAVYGDNQNDRPILCEVSCHLNPGEITLIIGKTGAGKSTLLQVIAGLSKPSSGDVTYDGQALWNRRRAVAAQMNRIGYVFQYPEHQLFARTVQAEFAYSLKPYRLTLTEREQRTKNAMSDVGLDAAVSERSPLTLSGGQKRRVALATTLATEPDWLLLDEPTAGLDPQATQHLIDYLTAHQSRPNGGVVIATHDLDTFFPIAKRVIVLAHGQIAAIGSPEWLCRHPHVLEDCAVGLPTCVIVAHSLAAQGIHVQTGLASPGQLASCIAARQTGYTGKSEGDEAAVIDGRESHADVTNRCDAMVATKFTDAQPPSEAQSTPDFLRRLDPRAKWICYIAVSAGILFQGRVTGLLLATLIASALVYTAGIRGTQLLRTTRPFLYLMLFSITLSALRFSSGESTVFWRWVGLSQPAAWVTFQSLYRLLLVMVLGGVLAWTTTQLSMKRGLEQALSGLKRWKVPVEAFSLGTSLVLRFMPLILKEVHRFALITRARGKSHARVGTVRFRDLPALVIPLLMSVFQFGEDLSIAMEARGYTHIGIRRTSALQRSLSKTDWVAMAVSLLLLIAMVVVSRI